VAHVRLSKKQSWLDLQWSKARALRQHYVSRDSVRLYRLRGSKLKWVLVRLSLVLAKVYRLN
jgi:hypothetical protein